MKEEYQPEKWKWNQDDFEQMGWHDCPVWAISFEDDVKLDLDYIFKWAQPTPPNVNFRFWISPATLIFKNPTKFKVEMETDFVKGLEIAGIEREIIHGKTTYTIEAQEGRIVIETEAYEQIIRRPPSLQISQYLPEFERGEINFSTESHIAFKPSAEILERRELSYKFDDLRSLKVRAQIEYEEFDYFPLDPKERIKKRTELKSNFEKYKNELEQIEREIERKCG